MSTLTFIGKSQTRKRNSGYDLWKEAGNPGTEQDYELALHGISVAQVALYKRASSTPNRYDDDGGSTVTYTFDSGSIVFANPDPLDPEVDANSGWHNKMYAGSDDIYVVYASANANGPTDIIPASQFSPPALLSMAGAQGPAGTSGCIVPIYKASSTDPYPSYMPTRDDVKFTFATGVITNLDNGWYKDAPAGDKIWCSTACASGTGTYATILHTAWSKPTEWKEKGADAIYCWLEKSATIISKDTNNSNTLNPTSVTVNAKKNEGGTTSAFAGTIKLYADGTEISPTSSTSTSISFNTSSYVAVYTIKLFAGSTELDSETIPVIATGKNGTNGANAMTAVLTNDSAQVPTDKDGNVPIGVTYPSSTIELYRGGTKVTDATYPTLTAQDYSGCTISQSGATVTLTGITSDYATVNLKVSYGNNTYTKLFTITKQKQGLTGATGVGVDYYEEEYAASSSDTQEPSSGWGTFAQAVAALTDTVIYIWNRETVHYTDETTDPISGHVVYRKTTDAKNITGINEYFAYGSDLTPISPADRDDPDWSTNWGLTPKVPDATAGHHYIWQCEELVFDDNTTSALTTARRVAQYVEDGKDADVFDFTVSSQTYAKNLRVVNTNSIKVTVSLQGQYSSSTVTVKHDNTSLSYITKKNGTAVTPTYSISVIDTDTLEVSIPMDVSFPVTIGMGSLEKVINCVDETEYGHNYGLLSTAPTVSSNPRLIFEAGKERDYYTSTVDGNTYEYVGNSEWIESESTPKLLTGLTDILNDTTYDLNNYQDANNVSLFRRILSKQVIAEVLKALQLIIGTEGTGLYVNISEDPESNQRRFVVKFGNDTIFEINPTTGTTSMTNATVIGDFISSGFATQKASDTHTLQKSISTANRWKEEDFVAAAITQFNAHNSYFGSRNFYFSDTSGSLYTKDSNLVTVSDTYTKIGAYTIYESSSVSYSTSLGSGIGQFGSWYFCYKNSSRRVLVFVDSYYTGDQSAAAKKVAAAAYNELSNFNDYTCKVLAQPLYISPLTSSQIATVIYGGTMTWNCASHLSLYYYDFSTISLDTTNKAFTGTVTINSTVVVTATAQNKYYIRFNTDRDRIIISNSSQVTVYTISNYNNYSWALDINVEAGVEGIKARNVMPFDSSSSQVGTSALPFYEGNFTKLTNSQNSNSTVWGAVFN